MAYPYLCEIDRDEDEVVVAASFEKMVEVLEGCRGEAPQVCLDLLVPMERVTNRVISDQDQGLLPPLFGQRLRRDDVL